MPSYQLNTNPLQKKLPKLALLVVELSSIGEIHLVKKTMNVWRAFEGYARLGAQFEDSIVDRTVFIDVQLKEGDRLYMANAHEDINEIQKEQLSDDIQQLKQNGVRDIVVIGSHLEDCVPGVIIKNFIHHFERFWLIEDIIPKLDVDEEDDPAPYPLNEIKKTIPR